MKTVSYLSLAACALMLSSCADIYVKDLLYGSPYNQAAAQNYRNAKAEGKSSGEAYGQSLLLGAEKSNQRWGKRQATIEKEQQIDRDFGGDGQRDPFTPRIRWN